MMGYSYSKPDIIDHVTSGVGLAGSGEEEGILGKIAHLKSLLFRLNMLACILSMNTSKHHGSQSNAFCSVGED